MEPLHLYMAALALIALPSAAFNKVAAVVVGTWAASFIVVRLGIPYQVAELAHHGVAAVLALVVARATPQFIAAALFVPMAAIDLWLLIDFLHGTAGMPTDAAWWTIYSMAWAQMVVLPLGSEPDRVHSAIASWRSRQTDKSNKRVAA